MNEICKITYINQFYLFQVIRGGDGMAGFGKY